MQTFFSANRGLYLIDLTHAYDGSPNMLATNKRLINFSKRRMIAEYGFKPVESLQAWLDTEFRKDRDKKELYDLSCKVEPWREDREIYLSRKLCTATL